MATNTQEVISKVFLNSTQAEEKLKQLEEQTKKFRAEWDKAAKNADMKGMKAAQKEIKRCEKEMKAFHTTASQVNKVLNNLSTSGPKELETTIKALNRELSSGKIKRGSEEWKILQGQLKKCKTELAAIRQESKAFDERGFFTKTADFLNKQWFVITSAIQSFTGLGATVRKTVQAFANMQEEMANVRKYTNQTAAEVEAMNEKFKAMDTRTSREELNQLAGAAGRLGISAEKDILEFVDAADKIGVALGDDLGDGAVDKIGKLALAFGENKTMGLRGAMLATGSAINALAASSAAQAGYLVEFAARIAGVGKQAGLTQAQIFGLAAALDENMMKEEMSATAVSQLLIKMQTDTATFARLAGVEVEKFSELVKNDFNAALTTLFRKLNETDGLQKLAPMFEEMGLDGTRCVAVLTTMAGKIDDITRHQKTATEAYAEGSSVLDEYNVQNNTVQAGIDKAKKKFNELAVELGEKLEPVVKYTITSASMLVQVLSTLISFVTKNIDIIVTLTASLTAYTVAANASAAAQKALNAAHVAGGVAMKALLGVKYLAIAAWELLRGKITGARVAMAMFNDVTKKNPIGALIAALTALVGMVVIVAKRMRELSEEEKALNQIKQEAINKTAEEEVKIKSLIKTAKDERESLENRQTAIRKLNELIPNYNAQLDATTGKYRENKIALDQYLLSLRRKYELEGAKDALIEIGKNIAKARMEMQLLEEQDKKYATTPRAGQVTPFGYIPSMGGDKPRLSAEWMKQEDIIKKEMAKRDAIFKAYTELSEDGSKLQIYMPADYKAKQGGGESQITKNKKYWEEQRDLAQKELDAMDKTLLSSKKAVELQNKIRKYQGYVDAYSVSKTDKATAKARRDAEREQKAAERKLTKAEREELKRKKDKDKEIQAWTDENITTLNYMYSDGLKTYREYVDEMYQLDMEGLELRKKVWEQGSKEYIAIEELEQKLTEKYNKEKRDMSLVDLERQYQSRRAILESQFYDEKSEMYQNEDALNEALFCNDMDYLLLKQDLYKKGTEEWYDLEAEITEREEQNILDKKIRNAQRLQEYRAEWLGNDLKQQEEITMRGLEELKNQGLVSEEDYRKILLRIKQYYADQAYEQEKEEFERERGLKEKSIAQILEKASRSVSEDDEKMANISNAGIGGDILGIVGTIQNYKTMYEQIEQMRAEDKEHEEEYAEAKRQLNFQMMESIVSKVQAAYNSINQIVNAAAAYSAACSQYEVAKITADYDKQIEAAGKNSKKKEMLEKERDEKIRKAKTEASKKSMRIELAQAFASTALSAINAYNAALQTGPAGLILAPIAAAMATAAGMLQIATIKKQHQTEEMGYYSGGFTKGRNYRREAGVVHEGEFVANHNAVNNPNLLPFFEFVDQAQKNNTVSALTAADVRSISGNGGTVVAPIVNVQNNNDDLNAVLLQMSETTQQLKERLDDGIHADVYADEMDKAIKKLNKLINNAHA